MKMTKNDMKILLFSRKLTIEMGMDCYQIPITDRI